MSIAFLLLAVLALALAALATRSRVLRGPWWAPAMAAAELAPWFLGGCAAVAGTFAAFRWNGGVVGSAGLVTFGLASALFALAVTRNRSSRPAIESGLTGLLGDAGALPRISRRSLLRPYPSLLRRLEVDTHSYGPHERHTVDRVALAGVTAGPVLIHVHGGGWWRGRRGRQARPLIRRMAENGWVVLAPTYRLSPQATFPHHLDDIERLISWVRASPEDLGADPGFIAVAGGSAGGQLAALAGLRDPTLGLVIPIYGVHDLLADDGTSPKWPYLETAVMKSDPQADPGAWQRASPIRSPSPERAPFLIIHGSIDWVVDAGESRELAAALRDAGGPAVGHVEVPWGNHGFDFFASVRSLLVVEGIAHALGVLNDRRLERAGGEP